MRTTYAAGSPAIAGMEEKGQGSDALAKTLELAQTPVSQLGAEEMEAVIAPGASLNHNETLLRAEEMEAVIARAKRRSPRKGRPCAGAG